jgi:predicted Zn-dependent peptidase
MVYSHYLKTVLENGLTIISEHIPSVRSISLGVWIKTGTRFEKNSTNGVAHFLEHMMFKGTTRKTPRQIARSLESVGGHINAFTSKELTCYYVEILDENLRKSVNLLADILCHSTLPEQEFAKEKMVILDEIQSLEDTPDELVQDYFVEKLFANHPLGLSILGTKETVSKLHRNDLIDFYARNYNSNNIIISGTGNIDHSRLVHLCDSAFTFGNGNNGSAMKEPKSYGKGDILIDKSINQAHICLGMPAFPYSHPRRYDVLILNTLLGGGMSSRLFQNIREKYGLAYSIYSFLDFFSDAGLFGIYLGTDKKNVSKALDLLEREITKLKNRPVSRKELKEVKAQLKGNLMLNMESTSSRMVRLAKMEIYNGCFKEIDEIIEEINGVNQDTLWETVQELFTKNDLLRIAFIPEN